MWYGSYKYSAKSIGSQLSRIIIYIIFCSIVKAKRTRLNAHFTKDKKKTGQACEIPGTRLPQALLGYLFNTPLNRNVDLETTDLRHCNALMVLVISRRSKICLFVAYLKTKNKKNDLTISPPVLKSTDPVARESLSHSSLFQPIKINPLHWLLTIRDLCSSNLLQYKLVSLAKSF